MTYQYINLDLKRLYNLNLSTHEKAVVNVDDLYLVLYHHWATDTATFPGDSQRLQFAFINLIITATETRPETLLYNRQNEKQRDEDEDDTTKEYDDGDGDWDNPNAKTLCYRDVTLIVLPNPEGIRDLLAMEVDLCHTKSHQRKPERKRFIQTEVDDLIFDPIMLMIALAIVDDAFKINVRSVQDVFLIRVSSPRRLKFNQSMHDVPIFRQGVHSCDRVQTSPTKALQYETSLHYLQRLGMSTGMMQLLQP